VELADWARAGAAKPMHVTAATPAINIEYLGILISTNALDQLTDRHEG
jgi:predicted secreted protein